MIADFADSYPFLLENSFGKGRAYLVTFPLPLHLDLGKPRCENVLGSLKLLKAIRDKANCTPPVDTDQPWIESALFQSRSDAEDRALLINWDRSEVKANVTIRGEYSTVLNRDDSPLTLTLADDNIRVPIHLPPNGVQFWRLRR